MTIKEQCLEKIQGYIDDCDEYKDPEHRYAALVLSIVKRDIELDIEEPAAANVVPVVHGEWKFVKSDENDMTVVQCSNCGINRYGTPAYCSRCGAKMDGGNE